MSYREQEQKRKCEHMEEQEIRKENETGIQEPEIVDNMEVESSTAEQNNTEAEGSIAEQDRTEKENSTAEQDHTEADSSTAEQDRTEKENSTAESENTEKENSTAESENTKIENSTETKIVQNTETSVNLNESMRIKKSEWIRDQIRRQREAEDAILEQMFEEQKVIDSLNEDINENLNRTTESRKFNQEFRQKMNTQIYEMNGVTEDKLKGIREYKNAYYQGCAFSLFLLSVVMIVICGVLHGPDSQVCLFMIACAGVEGALLAQDKWKNKFLSAVCKVLYLLIFPIMMTAFVCYELKYPEYELFLPYFAMGIVVVLIIATAAFFLYDPYKADKKRVKAAKDSIAEVEKIARRQVKKSQKIRQKEEKKTLRIQRKEEKKILRIQRKEEKKR